jgi:hypothetical protein
MLTSAEMVDARRFAGYAMDDPAIDPRLMALSADAEVVVRSEIVLLRGLEAAIPAAAARLSTHQAAVWHRNPTEIADRQALYYSERLLLCNLMGVAPGPFLGVIGISAGGASLAPVAFVV